MKTILVSLFAIIMACQVKNTTSQNTASTDKTPVNTGVGDTTLTKVVKSEAEWQKQLGTGLAYEVLRQKAQSAPSQANIGTTTKKAHTTAPLVIYLFLQAKQNLNLAQAGPHFINPSKNHTSMTTATTATV